MVSTRGGRRVGSGRPKGSKNKTTLAKEAIAEVLGVDESDRLAQEIHARGHTMLIELERIFLDRDQSMPARLMAAKIALPYMLPRRSEQVPSDPGSDDLVERILEGRRRIAEYRRNEANRAALTGP